MSGKSIISNSYLEDIGDAIRYKKGSENTYYPSQMGDAIRSIEGIVPAGTLEIDADGTYDVTEYAEAVVDVPDPVVTSLTVTEDGTYEVPSGVDGYNPVTVNTGIDALRSEIDSAVEVSGCDPLVEGITALTAYANEVTGASDTTLSDAVESLVAGYGGGSSPTTTAVINSDTKFISFSNSNMWYAGTTAKLFDNFTYLEVLYLDSVKNINSPNFFQYLKRLKAGIFPEVTNIDGSAFYGTGSSVTGGSIFDFHQTITTTGNLKMDALTFILRGNTKSSINIKKGTWGYPLQAKFYVPQSLVSEYVADSDIIAYGEENILPIEGSQYESVDWWKALI